MTRRQSILTCCQGNRNSGSHSMMPGPLSTLGHLLHPSLLIYQKLNNNNYKTPYSTSQKFGYVYSFIVISKWVQTFDWDCMYMAFIYYGRGLQAFFFFFGARDSIAVNNFTVPLKIDLFYYMTQILHSLLKCLQ